MKKIQILGSIAIWAILFLSCDKKAFLDARPNDALVVPTTLDELQAILDNDQIMNGLGTGFMYGPVPQIGEIASDNHYVLDNQFVTFSERDQGFYTWAGDNSSMESLLDWDRAYQTIFYANNVLDGLKDLNENNDRYRKIKAEALFHRAHAYLQISQVFAEAYDFEKPEQQGLVHRLSSDINEKLSLYSLKDSYNMIINDLEESLLYLPSQITIKSRPSKPAAYGLLSRIYLFMGDYDSSLIYADSCLNIYDTLLDFNYVNVGSNRPFENNLAIDSEVIFNCNMQRSLPNTPLNTLRSYIDTAFLNTFDDQDIRKEAFFRAYANGHRFKGSYSGTDTYFAGVATNEVWLNKAESLVRKGLLPESISVLNILLMHRWEKVNEQSTLIPFSSDQQSEILEKILEERRKELLYRGLRWADLKRLNKDGHEIELTRIVNGQQYRLNPNMKGWVYDIPAYVRAYHQDFK